MRALRTLSASTQANIEIIPHHHQEICHGAGVCSSQGGGYHGPFIVLLGDYHPNLQFTVFGLLSLSSGLINLKLPETKGKKLPDSSREMVMALDTKKG